MQILGIKGCVSLKTLECYSNNLSSLNMSDSKDLTHIDCHNNVLSSITLNSTLITYLDVSQNLLQTLDISLCPAIKCLYFTLNRPLNNGGVSKLRHISFFILKIVVPLFLSMRLFLQ